MQIIIEYPTLLPAAATIIVGLVVSTIAIIAIASNRNLAKKKNSLDTVLDIKADERLRDSIAVIRAIHLDPQINIEKYAYKSGEKYLGMNL